MGRGEEELRMKPSTEPGAIHATNQASDEPRGGFKLSISGSSRFLEHRVAPRGCAQLFCFSASSGHSF